MKKFVLFLLLIPNLVLANGVFDFDLVLSKARTSGSVNLILDNGQQANITKQHAEKINEVRQNISSVAGIYPKFFISSDLQMNAYAQGAGGQGVVTITYGLLNRIGNDYDALAAVIGHEFAHLDLDHSSSQAAVNAIVDILSTVALVAIDLSWGGSQYNQHRELHKIGLDVGNSLAKSAYSRDDEYDADAKGVEYMLKAGYQIDGAYRMHNNIIASSAGWFDTHPSSSNRVAYIRKFANDHTHLVERNRRSNQNKIKVARHDPTSTTSSGGGYDPNSFTNIQSQNKDSLANFKEQCSELGFTEKTENYGLCVMKLHKKNKNPRDKKIAFRNDKKIEDSECSRSENYYTSFKIECENLPYRTGGGYDPKNEGVVDHRNKQIGLVLDVKEDHKYIIFSSVIQKNIPIGSKIIIDERAKVFGTVSRHFEGFYSARVDDVRNIQKGQKIHETQ